MSTETKSPTEGLNLTQIYKDLSADFPAEALSKDSSRGFDLTSLKAQYIVERLNTVLGMNGWQLSGQFTETDGGVLYKGFLTLINPNNGVAYHAVEAIGFSLSKKVVGDTYKGARTDALSKAASYIGVGNEVFKGNVAVPGKSTTESKTKSNGNNGTRSTFKKQATQNW